jgi:hypothetical protein
MDSNGEYIMNSELSAMNMNKSAFFKYEISEILNPEKENDQPSVLREQVELFVRDCAGTADGEMDISFQENGRGYYAHLHEIERLRDVSQGDYLEYRRKLLLELNDAQENNEITHQMKIVCEQLSRLED